MNNLLIPKLSGSVLQCILSSYDYIIAIISKRENDVWLLDSYMIKSDVGKECIDDSIIITNADSSRSGKVRSLSEYLDDNKIWRAEFSILTNDSNLFIVDILLYVSEVSFEKRNYKIYLKDIQESENKSIDQAIWSKICSFISIAKELYTKKGIQKSYYYCTKSNINGILSNYSILFGTLTKLESAELQTITCLLSSCTVDDAVRRISIESIKSAKAAIMSRNMSHNLGSHYIANTKNYISNLANAKNDSDLRGLTHLLQYIQERMDYIATVISNDVYPLGALNFKSQIFDELTVDDCGERHGKDYWTTNFLLKYIVFSEKYSRTDKNSSGLKNLMLEVYYPEAESEVKVFTGTTYLSSKETALKLELSKLNIAVPCGIMARHALFNIIENIIRNSAKHNRNNSEDLKIRIALKKNDVSKQLEISIYDNKGGYEKLIGENKDGLVAERLKRIRFLEQDGSGFNKENKGLKEMIISALWLKNEDVGEIMAKIDSAVDGEEKYKLITEKCLQIKDEGGNLAYVISLPLYQEIVDIDDSFKPADLKGICADVIVGDKLKSGNFDKSFGDIFTRYLIENDELKNMTGVDKLKRAIHNNLGINVDDYKIHIDGGKVSTNYTGKNVYPVLPKVTEMDNKQICFVTHFDIKNDSEKKDYLNQYKEVAYLDSISGENFTSTLVTPEFLDEEYLKCKVIESALTKIAIIDERIYEKFAKNEKQKQMSKEKTVRAYADKNINTVSNLIDYITENYPSLFAEEKDIINKLLNKNNDKRLDESSVNIALNILFPVGVTENVLNKRGIFIYTMEQGTDNLAVLKSISGQNTPLSNEEKLAEVHFLSIHLGLIEKYKNSGGVNKLMSNIKAHFPGVKYISIHSGRGNFSADLSKELKGYCFMTLSALEAALNNSKYMLAQLFYNMNYYGKGNINND